MASGSLSEVVAALSDAFSSLEADLTPPALSDLERTLSTYVIKNRKSDGEHAGRLQEELLSVYRQEIEKHPKKLGLFVTVLRHLQPALATEDEFAVWFDLAVKPFVRLPDARRTSIEDAQDFVVEAMVYDDDAADARERARTSAKLAKILLDEYMVLTCVQAGGDQDVPLQLKSQAAQRLQSMLVAFGRKKAKDLFLAIDNYLVIPASRFQALGLLAVFVGQQQAHLYLVVHTAVVEHLLKSLMNDTSTVVVSAALSCLTMLLPHIPATVATQLPRLFLVYSRCLCWEKFSASSTRAQRDLVTDERVRRGSDSEESDDSDTNGDPTWSILHAMPDMPESSAPELLHYFTYLYALYPLNFMSYIRKPRKYLKNIDFPGADDFDLDQTVIRSRTEQFQRLHLLHSSFFNSTLEDELTDNRWLKAEPSEVIAECHALYAGHQVVMPNAGPPPTAKLPALPTLPAADSQPLTEKSATSPDLLRAAQIADDASDQDSLTQSGGDDRQGSDTASANTLSLSPSTIQDVLQVQRELMLLRNELTFERYLKHQHVAAIAQLRRNHIKAVTIEAETATLINANRALQKKLGDANRFNEKMQKETQARRTHTKQSEEQLTAKIRSLRADLANQESLQRDLRQAIEDGQQLRQLLVESEARELGHQEELEALRATAQDAERLHREISELTRQLRMHGQLEMEFETTQTEQQMTKQELDSAKLLLSQQNQELDRSKRFYQARILELETNLSFAESNAMELTQQDRPEWTAELQATLSDTRHRLAQTKKAYSQLLSDHTDLKIKYQELMVDAGRNMGNLNPVQMRPHDYGMMPGDRSQDGSMHNRAPVNARAPYLPDRRDNHAFSNSHSQTEAFSQNYIPTRPIRPNAYQQRMENDISLSHSDSGNTRDDSPYSSAAWAAPQSMQRWDYEISRPDMSREQSRSAFSINSEDGHSSVGTGKIKAKSEVRVYGRGGAQNIKLKGKNKPEGPEKPSKTGGMRNPLRGIM